jgi:hypothetical protein
MPGKRITAFMLAALSISALRMQSQSITPASSPSSGPLLTRRPTLGEPAPQTLPPVMHLCIAHCFAIRWENGHYVNFAPQITSIYTVDSFTRGSLVMHRTDTGRVPLTAVLSGEISDDGNTIVNGKIVWTSGNTGEGLFRAGWRSGLDSVPGSDQEEQQRRAANIPCNASTRVSAEEAEERGERMIEADDLVTAACWFRIGAKLGDSGSQGTLSAILYGVPADIPEAVVWAEKSSAQGDYEGEHTLALMYANGRGKPKDSAKAQYWASKSATDKQAFIDAIKRKQEALQLSAQAQTQQTMAIGWMIMELVSGAFSADSESPRRSSIVCSAASAMVCAQTQ